MTQLMATRKARKGGRKWKKDKENQQEWFRNWRVASLKLKHMIDEKCYRNTHNARMRKGILIAK